MNINHVIRAMQYLGDKYSSDARVLPTFGVTLTPLAVTEYYFDDQAESLRQWLAGSFTWNLAPAPIAETTWNRIARKLEIAQSTAWAEISEEELCESSPLRHWTEDYMEEDGVIVWWDSLGHLANAED